MKDGLARRPIPELVTWLLIGLLAAAVAPHFRHLSLSIIGLFGAMAGWRLLAVRRPRLLPNRWILLALTLFGMLNVLLSVGLVVGRRSGVALLVAMLGLKLLELRTRRDVYISVFLGYFIVVTQFLFDQSLGVAIYLGLIVIGLTGILTALNRAAATPPAGRATLVAVRLLGAAIPAMAVLFVLFPRTGGPLWAIGVAEGSGMTGISDRISPGSIGQLSQSSAIAFRVKFIDTVPAPKDRYWRGPVLWRTDGQTWTTGSPETSDKAPAISPGSQRVQYEVTLEPTQQRWLFPLELPLDNPPHSQLGRDLVIRTAEPLDRKFTYRAVSAVDARITSLSRAQRTRALQLPPTVTARMRALVARWRAAAQQPLEVVAQALDHFNTEPFVYTLNPPTLGERPEDAFLFETRQGFCEHYATSFTLLMRLADIPARIVAGYQGGEFNPRGGFYTVRQSDAHAWAEVWLPQTGWYRVDPTAAVAPERVRSSITPLVSDVGAPVLFQLGSRGMLAQALRELRWLADSVELGWHRWVVGFSQARQRNLFAGLGLDKLKGYAQGLAAIVLGALALGVGALLLRLGPAPAVDPALQAYRRLQRKLLAAGLPSTVGSGPRDLRDAAMAAFPAKRAELRRVFELYIGLRYGRPIDPIHPRIRRLRAAVARLRLTPARRPNFDMKRLWKK